MRTSGTSTTPTSRPLPARLTVRLAGGWRPPPAAIETRVAALWQSACARTPNLFNGRIFSALEVHPDSIVGYAVEYRYSLAQLADPGLFEALRIRPVAVSGILGCREGIVFGRRAMTVTQFPGHWELVPAGGIDTAGLQPGEEVDFCGQLLVELTEELGIERAEVQEIRPVCLVEDPVSHVLNIGIELVTALDAGAITTRYAGIAGGHGEYDELRVVPAEAIAAFVASESARFVAASLATLGYG